MEDLFYTGTVIVKYIRNKILCLVNKKELVFKITRWKIPVVPSESTFLRVDSKKTLNLKLCFEKADSTPSPPPQKSESIRK